MRWILVAIVVCVAAVSFGQESVDAPLPQVAEIISVSEQLQDLEGEIVAVNKRLAANRGKTSTAWKKLIAKDENRLQKLQSQRDETSRKLDALNAEAKAERERRKRLPPVVKKTPQAPVKPAHVEPSAEPFSMLRRDGSFRSGDNFFTIGEAFSLNPFFNKSQADKNRELLKRGENPKYVMDLDNVSIIQVLGENSVLASFRGKSPVFLMRGIDTSEIREKNLDSWWVSGVFKVTGTHRYETRRGTMNTVFVLEPIGKIGEADEKSK